MAIPVSFRQFTPKNSRQDLLRRLESAPEQHVQALLASYELLQRMHDEGLIDLANGVLSAGGTVMTKIADVMKSPTAVIAIRITLMFANLLRMINPDELHCLLSGAKPQSTSLAHLARQMMSDDARVGLATSVELLRIFGAAIRECGKERSRQSASASAPGLSA